MNLKKPRDLMGKNVTSNKLIFRNFEKVKKNPKIKYFKNSGSLKIDVFQLQIILYKLELISLNK